MNKRVELPLMEPIYSTYHNGIASAMIVDNPTIRNWYLNECMILKCERDFLFGYTSPKLDVADSGIFECPYVDFVYYYTYFLGNSINKLIRNILDFGWYVYFSGVDDFYVSGKSWYNERHFIHDGAICGYDQENKTYCIYAYDSNWVYRKFWTTQKDFEKGRKACLKNGYYGGIYAIKPSCKKVDFLLDRVKEKLVQYLDSNEEKFPTSEKGTVYGIAVHSFIGKYIDKLYDNSIPYERMDRRIFRLIWEHKKLMLERIEKIEETLNFSSEISRKYKEVVSEADAIRMLYASHHIKRRDSVLPIIKKKLFNLADKEKELLTLLVDIAGKELENETVEVSQK